MANLVQQPAHLRVSPARQVGQLVTALPSIINAGVLAARGPTGAWGIIKARGRWGFSLAFLLETAASYSPQRTAIIDDFGELTYQQWRRDAHRFAAALSNRGVTEHARVAVVARNSRVIPTVLVACALLGAVPMVMNPMSSPAQLRATLRSYQASVVIADAELIAGLADAGVPAIVGYGEPPADSGATSWEAALAEADGSFATPHKPPRVPTVIMSSGTTGTPKGVVRAVPKTPQVLGSILPKIPWRLGGIIQQTASLFHAWGWLNLNLALATKSTIILRRHFDAAQAVADCRAYGVTGIVSAAVFLRDFVRALGDEPLRQIEFIASSGNAIPTALVRELNERFGPVVCNFYGSTEHGPIAVASGRELAQDPDRAGTIAKGIRLAILREDGSRAQAGEVGMIYSANSESMAGYLSTRDDIAVHDGMLGTGDLGFLDEDGFLHVRGRYDDMVIKGGENVYPKELEDFLHKAEGIADAYVRGVRGEIVSRLDAFVVRAAGAAGAALTDHSLRSLVREHLAEHNIPDRIVWLDRLPRNDAGKVVPRQLPTEEN